MLFPGIAKLGKHLIWSFSLPLGKASVCVGMSPEGQTYRTYALQSDVIDCDLELETGVIAQATPYPTTAKPVFVRHYWLSADRPEVLAENVECLDYSVAKGGFLCAYRGNGEQKLSDENFECV